MLQRQHPRFPPAVVSPISAWARESAVTKGTKTRRVGKSSDGEKPGTLTLEVHFFPIYVEVFNLCDEWFEEGIILVGMLWWEACNWD